MDFSEGLKKVLYAGVGVAAVTAEAAKEVADVLVKKGEEAFEQGKVINEELKHSAKEKMKDHVTVNIVREYRDVNSAVKHMSKEEREALKRKLEKMEAEGAREEKAAEENSKEDADGKEEMKTDSFREAEDSAEDCCTEENGTQEDNKEGGND